MVTARSSHFRDNGDTNNVILCIIIALNVFVIVASGQGQSFIVFFVILNYGLSPSCPVCPRLYLACTTLILWEQQTVSMLVSQGVRTSSDLLFVS